jgi:hypothetical protein
MKILLALGIAFVLSNPMPPKKIVGTSNHEQYLKQSRLYFFTIHDQDTTRKVSASSDSAKQTKRQETRIKQSKNNLPSETAKPESLRRVE